MRSRQIKVNAWPSSQLKKKRDALLGYTAEEKLIGREGFGYSDTELRRGTGCNWLLSQTEKSGFIS